jgi:hypothetical protein
LVQLVRAMQCGVAAFPEAVREHKGSQRHSRVDDEHRRGTGARGAVHERKGLHVSGAASSAFPPTP